MGWLVGSVLSWLTARNFRDAIPEMTDLLGSIFFTDQNIVCCHICQSYTILASLHTFHEEWEINNHNLNNFCFKNNFPNQCMASHLFFCIHALQLWISRYYFCCCINYVVDIILCMHAMCIIIYSLLLFSVFCTFLILLFSLNCVFCD